MVEMDPDDFEAIAQAEYDAMPQEWLDRLENVAILIQDQPAGARPELYGLYQGHPATKRGQYGYGELPDRITLFRNTILAHCATRDEVQARVRITLRHEIGHYFGMDDAKLRELGWA